ncbi:Arginyl-tRNA synthetase [Actinomortierella wolfii]|nr:Arginyl-tRNA synthetase [Actinomortierella wolfii]
MADNSILDRRRPLAVFVDNLATHLARVLDAPAINIVPLVRLNTLHRKPNQGALIVPIKALAQLISAPASLSPPSTSSSSASSKASSLHESQIQQCIDLDADEKIRRYFISARRVKELLHFDPDPVQILQLTIQSVQYEYKASSPQLAPASSPSTGTSSTEANGVAGGKRSRASDETIVINGTLLKQDEDSYTSLRRIITTVLMANVQDSKHSGTVKIYLERDVSSMDECLARLVRGLNVEQASLVDNTDDASLKSLKTHFSALKQLFTTNKTLELNQKEDKSWHLNLSGAGLNSVKIYETTGDDGTMDRPALATQVLAMLLSHFDRHNFEKYIWVVSDGRQMLASQVLYIAEKLFATRETQETATTETILEGEAWAKKIQVVTFGPASGPDIWKKESDLPKGPPGIITSTINRTRQVVQEKEEKISEALECEESDEAFDEASLEKMAVSLAYSSIAMSYLSNKRSKRLVLDIDSTVTKRGNTGIFLQYVYARLCGIERKANVPLDFEADLQLLKQHPESINLALAIAEWPEMMTKLEQTQDPYVLSSYLFALASEVGQANRVLRVKGMEPKLAKARWLLFWAAKYRLAQGLQLCGLDLVERM